MPKNRLLFITQDYPPPNVGGSLVYMYNLVENSDHFFDVLTAQLPAGEKELVSDRQRTIRSRFLAPSHDPGAWRLFLMYSYIALWAIRIGITREYDAVVYYTSAIGNGFFSFLFKLLRVKVTVMAFAEELTLARNAPGLKGRLKRFMMSGYRFADGFVSICDFAKSLIVELGVPEEKNCVIPTPFCPSKVVEHGRSAARQHPFEILTVGRLVERKGFRYVIEAVNKLRFDLPDVHLTVVGGGPEMSYLVQMTERLGLTEQVEFTGSISEDHRLAGLYARCDVFVLGNLMMDNGDCEGSPNVLIEASAQGKPVIAGEEGGTSTAVRHGVTGYLVDPRDVAEMAGKLKELLLDKELARAMGEAGRRKVLTEHDPRRAGRRFSEFLDEVSSAATRREECPTLSH